MGAKADLLVGFAVLTARGFLYTLSDNSYWLVGVQLLDGIGAGIFGALFPLVVQDVTHGTGHFNISLRAVTTATGIGAALSNLVAGWIVVVAGYDAAFMSLGALAGAGFLLYLVAMPETVDSMSARSRPTLGGSDQYHSSVSSLPPALADFAFWSVTGRIYGIGDRLTPEMKCHNRYRQ